jgi:hypothetical protein
MPRGESPCVHRVKNQEKANQTDAQRHPEHEDEQCRNDIVLLPARNSGRYFAQEGAYASLCRHWVGGL